MCRYLALVCLSFALLAFDALGSSSVKPRSKRYVHGHTTKVSFKDLTLELAKKHLLKMIAEQHKALLKAKESLYILQRDECTNVKKIGKPVAHNSRFLTQGVWMKDPLEIMGAETIFVMEGYNTYILEEYENMNKFKAGLPRKKFKLPYTGDGTGAVVYGPHLYYNRENTSYIVKYNLNTGQVEAQIDVSRYYVRERYYQGSRFSGMDLAVDEQGLWVIVGTRSSRYPLYLAKIDVVKNHITHGWNLRTNSMNSLENAFVACGVIYTIDDYNSRSTTINFAYDTKTGKQWNPNIHFTNQFGYNSMVDYNPREKVLYSWDNKHQVTYTVHFEQH